MSRNYALRLAAFCCVSGLSFGAQASIVATLQSNTLDTTNGGYIFTYNGLLTADQGLSTGATNLSNGVSYGSKLVIFDFGNYIAGSVFSSNTNRLML